MVLGQFLILNKDEDLFKTWLKDTIKANAKQANDCFTCLNEWSNNFM